MKNLLLLFILSFFSRIAHSQNSTQIDTSLSKIYIIGVVHSENKYRNTDSLHEILKKLKPDLILRETDTLSGFFKKDYTFIPFSWRYKLMRKLGIFKKMSPEIEVVYKYLKNNNSVSIYPFDIWIPNRNKYVRNMYNMDIKWSKDYNFASVNNEIPNTLLSFHKDYIKYENWFYGIFRMSYFEMNQKIVSDSLRQMVAFEKIYFPKVTDSVKRLNSFKDYRLDDSKYWDLRNETMVNNILRFIEIKNAKRVVVFTGLLHKYCLTDLLTKRNTDSKIKLIEYYEE
jgi:hypothetical protein